MRCPYCSYEESKVVDSRATDDYTAIRRRRECLRCSKRYTTYEKVEDIPILVIKKDSIRETFNKDKIMSGIVKACQKRPVSRSQMQNIVDDIEKNISNKMIVEIKSEDIGEMVMERLQKTDEVAYVRFASVYRQFKDINSFMEELARLIKKS